MAKLYLDVDVKIFGAVNVSNFNENTKSNMDQNKNIKTIWKEEKGLMVRCRNKIIRRKRERHSPKLFKGCHNWDQFRKWKGYL